MKISSGQEDGLEIFLGVHLNVRANGFLTPSYPVHGDCNTPQMGIFHQ